MIYDQSGENLFQLASDFVQHTSQNIFLTGKAGTGKTTFLKYIKDHCEKNLVVIAPTGVAAINAGGVTAHSFFQLPFGMFYPGVLRGGLTSENIIVDRHHLLYNFRLSNEKRDTMRNLELLVIDEVSMLRADLLDAIDAVLRFVRNNHSEPLGGVQALLIGDLYQLPPVVKENEWQLLREFYASPFFFEAQVYKQAVPLFMELKKVYRQQDADFIHLLNRVRNNAVEESDILRLHQLYKPGFRPPPEKHFITLTTHNYKADDINAQELKRLAGKEFISDATIDGDFPDRNFPVEKSLRMKEGAQVMFVRNDTEEKKYFNGKIGILRAMDYDDEGEFMLVEFPETNEKTEVRKVTWKNIRYKFNETENKIEEEALGSFSQYPVRLAWAVTIHKSQGLTFQRAVIDAGNAFAPGQVYVALSRCVSLEGIVLLSQIPSNVIMTDDTIVRFMNEQKRPEDSQTFLEKEKQIYTIRKSFKLFTMQPAQLKSEEFIRYTGERKIENKDKVISSLYAIKDSLIQMEEVAGKFREQVSKITADGLTEGVQKQLDVRIAKAKAYFEKELDEKVNAALKNLNRELQQQYKVKKLLSEMKSFMDFCSHFTGRFRLEPERKIKSDHQPVPDTEKRAGNPEQLFEWLRQIRRSIANEENVAPFTILHDSTLKEMVAYLPQTFNELAMIKGMGDRKLSDYGEKFLTAILNYCAQNGAEGRIELKQKEMQRNKLTKKNKPAAGGDTRSQSFWFFQQGKPVAEIARIRQLTEGTVESHLCYFIQSGELDIFNLISKEKYALIKETLQSAGESLSVIKNKLGNDTSYGEIRFVIAAMNFEKQTQTKQGAVS